MRERFIYYGQNEIEDVEQITATDMPDVMSFAYDQGKNHDNWRKQLIYNVLWIKTGN